MIDYTTTRRPFPSLRATLALDAAFEFVAGGALVLFAGTLGAWLAVGTALSIAMGVVFIAAGAAIVMMLRAPVTDRGLVRALAVANVAGGVAGWAALLLAWGWLGRRGAGCSGWPPTW